MRSIASLRTYVKWLVSLRLRGQTLNGSNLTYEISGLVCGDEGPDEDSRVSGDYQHLLYRVVRFQET